MTPTIATVGSLCCLLFFVLFIKTKQQQKAQVQYRPCLQISVLNPHYPVLLRVQMKGFRTVFHTCNQHLLNIIIIIWLT